jgi:hypothetical protein
MAELSRRGHSGRECQIRPRTKERHGSGGMVRSDLTPQGGAMTRGGGRITAAVDFVHLLCQLKSHHRGCTAGMRGYRALAE